MEVLRPVKKDGRGRLPASVTLAVFLGFCVTPAVAAEPKFEFDVGAGHVWTNNPGYTAGVDSVSVIAHANPDHLVFQNFGGDLDHRFLSAVAKDNTRL